jgi:hypothetical protein
LEIIMDWLLLDTWDWIIREVSDDGFSAFETYGNRQLSELPRCPRCKRSVWERKIDSTDKIKFTERRVGDITFGTAVTLLVSDRFRDRWNQAGLSGMAFSDSAEKCKFRARSIAPSDSFYFAYPQPIFTGFKNTETLECAGISNCSFCESREVVRVHAPQFASVAPGKLDCMIPSCMPGWVVISGRAFEKLTANHLLNISVMKGFSWTENRKLERINYSMQKHDGSYQHYNRKMFTLT